MNKFNLMQTIWKGEDGKAVSCIEKLKVLEQNLNEILSVYKDAEEDAILFGVSKESFKENIMEALRKI